MKNVTCRYLGHSAVLVETGTKVFLFDYAKRPGTSAQNGLDSGIFSFEAYKDKPVYVFFSHNHGDHFSRTVFNDGLAYKNVTFILGDIASKHERAHSMTKWQSLTLDGMEIFTGASRDAGVCFLVKTEELTIIHLGDNANWEGGDLLVSFKDEVNFLAQHTDHTDLLFNPTCDFDGYMYDMLVEGAVYAINTLKPTYFMPIHANGREYLYANFKEIHEKSCDCSEMLLPVHVGDVFSI